MRYRDWEGRLADYLRGCRAARFAWGAMDCCTFAAGAVRAMTGEDAMAEFRGHYRTARGSARALRRIGAGTLEATLDAKFTAVPPALARRGDIVMADDGQGGGALGIVLGGHATGIGAQGDHEGLVRLDRASWLRGWRVE